MMTYFYNFFTVGLSSKFATRSVLYFPPYLQRVATLPCEERIIKNSKIVTYLT